MKKKIAIYANGWNKAPLMEIIRGMRSNEGQNEYDLFVYFPHNSWGGFEDINRGETNIYDLHDISAFDGAIVLANLINSNTEPERLCRRAQQANVPVVSIGQQIPGVPYIGADNSMGMRELVTHLVEVHRVKRVVFFGGTPDHVDSVERLRVTKEVLAEHGLTLREEDIFYANWSYLGSMLALEELLEGKDKLPDAIVCANDVIAMSTASELLERGYELPRDVLVTGYDNIEQGRFFYPALTTVAQGFAEMGLECARLLDRFFVAGTEEEEKLNQSRMLAVSRMVCAESCGCCDEKYETIRQKFCGNLHLKTMRNNQLEQVERVMQTYVIPSSRDYESLKRNLQGHYQRNHQYEGDEFYLMLNPAYFDDVFGSETELFGGGYENQTLDVTVALKGGKLLEGGKYDRRELVPGYHPRPGIQETYFFVPLHAGMFNYGVVIMTEKSRRLNTDILYTYLERMQQACRGLRTSIRLDKVNKKLTQIYDKDQMTGLHNRFGYEEKAIPLFEECHKRHGVVMIMFVDINYMKKINDIFGHIHGDKAICLVADAIRANIREEWIAVRFGGDEFLIVGTDCDEDTARDTKAGILDYLDEKNRDHTRPYQISASCGYVLSDPDSPKELQDYIREADDLMYEIKREIHKND